MTTPKYGILQQPLVGSNLIETLSEDGRCTIIEDNFKIKIFHNHRLTQIINQNYEEIRRSQNTPTKEQFIVLFEDIIFI